MIPDQAEQLDTLLSQSARVLNKNQTKETDASTTLKIDKRDIQVDRVKAEKKGTNVPSVTYKPMTMKSKSKGAPQKVALVHLTLIGQ